MGIAPDTKAALVAKFEQALEWGADILLTSGGVSMGDRDLIKPLLEETGVVFATARQGALWASADEAGQAPHLRHPHPPRRPSDARLRPAREPRQLPRVLLPHRGACHAPHGRLGPPPPPVRL
eukprot:400266-Prorocentrum_minimum.AAC.1